MADHYRMTRSTRTCAATGEAIEAGTPFYSALLEGDELFERRDYSMAAWPDVDKSEFFSYWKNKGTAAREDKKTAVDYERLLSFFDRLEGEDDPQKRLFRYVLALILVRRRRLRLDDMRRTPEGDMLVVWDRRHEKVLEITSPEASKEDLRRVQDKLSELFEGDVEEE